MIYVDQRWIGNHGIGRFARHALAGLHYRPIALTSHPAAPLDAWRLSRALRSSTPRDLFFSPGYNAPLYCAGPFVFTIHDLSHVYCPENSSPLIQLYYATILKRACHRAVKIVTVSEFTRHQIAVWSGVPGDKIVNVGCGADDVYNPHGELFGLPFPYLLCVSNRKRHKNEYRLVEAFARAAIDPRIHLAFTGGPTGQMTRWIQEHQVSSRVDFLGPVCEERLPSLYRGASATLFVSLYEGFGLPVLEAMACGTPVVTSNVTAMPEVAGDAAVLVNPTSVEHISNGIAEAVTNHSLRAVLRQRGLKQAASFSWESTRQKVHRLLKSASSRHDSGNIMEVPQQPMTLGSQAC